MIQKLIRLLIIGVVLYIVYIIAGMIVAALGAPAIFLTLVVVILLLVFIYEILQTFGISI
jgi:energy-coupling factor transporter transmembrane protein EcfT